MSETAVMSADAADFSEPKAGVLLVNLGTPDEPTSAAVRRYLGEFLHDYRVVDINRWIWCPVLHGIILRVRPPKVAKLYASIWTEDGSPLMAISKQQMAGLKKHLASTDTPIELAMTYGNPSIKSGIEKLKKQGVERVVVLPLYPQYSSATSASVFDRVAKAMKTDWDVPAFEFIRHYHTHPLYIRALANSVREFWANHQQPDKLVMSFHGIPKRYADNGDPYPHECRQTAELLAKELGLNDDQWMLTFQSRFGREEWLQPYTDVTLEHFHEHKVKSIHVICPGFSADCLETLEEIQEENKDIFMEHGGESFEYIPCLNARDDHIDLLYQLVKDKI